MTPDTNDKKFEKLPVFDTPDAREHHVNERNTVNEALISQNIPQNYNTKVIEEIYQVPLSRPVNVKYKCQLCSYSSHVKFRLTQHHDVVHLKKTEYECPQCLFSTSTKTDLERHINVVHNIQNNKYLDKCQFCKYSTKRKDALTQHFNAVHLKIKNLNCNLCTYSSSQKGTLNRHIRLKHGKPNQNALATFGKSTGSSLESLYAQNKE